jgi:outer membrane protease
MLASLMAAPCRSDAAEMKGMVEAAIVSMTGHTKITTAYDGGRSVLKWPVDTLVPSLKASLSWLDTFEAQVGVASGAWTSSSGFMKDFDYLDESSWNMQPHRGIDIFSRTELDSKALDISANARYFPLRSRFLKAGVCAGYSRKEYDFRGYGTRQWGYGPWSDQTQLTGGPTTHYWVKYDVYSVGLVLDTGVPGAFNLGVEASSLPVVHARDEDDHLRRERVSSSSTRGSGYRMSISGRLAIFERWALSLACAYERFSTDGRQSQYWYGDDGATHGLDDTGKGIKGIDADLDADFTSISVGVVRMF